MLMQDLSGQCLGQYQIIELQGQGGMAEVYKAYQSSLDRFVAVKVLHPIVSDDEQFLARFRREAKAVAALRHPNIVQIYDFGEQEGRYYMVMEFVEGQTLKHRLDTLHKAGKLTPLNGVARTISEVADALYYAHKRKMVHRDVKPANVLLTAEDQAVLTDFGIAYMVEGTRYTLTGSIGTPNYMSPEQGLGQKEDSRSDIYSLGVVLYEMLTGKVPFSADNPVAVIFKHVQDPLLPPRSVNPDLPDAVEQVVIKAMAKDPEERYNTAAEMSEALQEAIAANGYKIPAFTSAREVRPAYDNGPVLPETETPQRLPVAAPTPEPVSNLLRSRSLIIGSILTLLVVSIALVVGSSALSSMPPPSPVPTMTNALAEAALLPTSTPSPTPSPLPPTSTSTPVPPTETSTPEPTATVRVIPSPTITPSPTNEEVLPYRYDAPTLLEPEDEAIVTGDIVYLKWEPVAEQLADNEWYAVRLVYWQQGKAVYEGDRSKVPEWKVPERLHYVADGPELLYQWYVFVEQDNTTGSAQPISPESEPLTFRWE